MTELDRMTVENTRLKEENARVMNTNDLLEQEVVSLKKKLLGYEKPTVHVPVTPTSFKFTGRVGGPFNIDGKDLGNVGVVSVAGRTVVPSRWKPNSIKGMIPRDFPSGEVDVNVNGLTLKVTLGE